MRVPSRVSFGALDFSFGQTVAPVIAPELAFLMEGARPITDVGVVRESRRNFIVKGNEVATLGTSGTFPGEQETTLIMYNYGPNAGKADLVLTAQVAVQGWSIVNENKAGAVYALSIRVPTDPPIPIDSLSTSIDLVDKAIKEAQAQVSAGEYDIALKVLEGARAQSTAGMFVANIFEEMGILSSQAADAFATLLLELKGQIQNLDYEIRGRGSLVDQAAKAILSFAAKVASVITPIFDKDVADAKVVFANFLKIRQEAYSSIKSISLLPPDLQKAPEVQDALKLFTDRLAGYNQIIVNAERIAASRGMTLKDLFGVDTQLTGLGAEGTIAIIIGIMSLIISAIMAYAFLVPALTGTKEQKEIQREGIILQKYLDLIERYQAKGESEALAIKHANEYIRRIGAFAPEDIEKFTNKAMPQINKAIEKGKELEREEIKKVAAAGGETDNAHWPILIGAAVIIGIIIYYKTRKKEEPSPKPRRA